MVAAPGVRQRFRPSRAKGEGGGTNTTVYWYLSFRCNLACRHCWVMASPQVDTSADLTTQEAMAVVDQLVELGAARISLSGGEALLRRDTVEILAALGEKGIHVSLETNGLVVSDRFLRVARPLQERRLLSIGISLDGGTAATHESLRGANTFERTRRGLARLAEAGLRFGIQATLNKENYRTIPQLYQIAREHSPHLFSLAFATLNPVGRGDELARSLGLERADLYAVCELIRRHKASFDGLTILKVPPAALPPRYADLMLAPEVCLFVTCQFPVMGILPNGDVSICALTRDDPALRLGNVKTHRLEAIWRSWQLDRLHQRYLAAEGLQGICGDCVFRTSCRGCCRAWAYQDGGSFDAPHPVCAALDQAGQFPAIYRRSGRQALGTRAPAAGVACGVRP
ncbi:MAG TPA: radical SAM protein [Thermoanaerobaculia bacterium]|nr:radical SAM protein [Thermoanaerobaculia bacterium]